MKDWNMLNVLEKIELLHEQFNNLQQACPNNYSAGREHKWKWGGTTYVRYGCYMTFSGESRRDGVYRTCQYCEAVDWSLSDRVKELAAIPEFKKGDKVIYREETWKYEKTDDGSFFGERIPDSMTVDEYKATVQQAWVSGDGDKLQWRYEIVWHNEKDEPVTRTPLAENLRFDTELVQV